MTGAVRAPRAAAPAPRLPATASWLERGLPALLALVAALVYGWTAYRTVSFWDAGEFITTSYRLGVPHQPSTPLYVLIGRLASLVPIGSVAFRVNLLSAVAAAGAVCFWAAGARIVAARVFAGDRWRVGLATVLVASYAAFGRTVWGNAIEAEVYALANLVMALTQWLVLRAWAERARDDRLWAVGFYALSLAIGIHLGAYLVLPGLVVLVLISERLRWRAVAVAGLWVVALVAAAGATAPWSLSRWVVAIIALGSGLFLARGRPEVRSWALWMGGLFVLGVSVHVFLWIRAGLDPVINEADPSSWTALMDTLNRRQYPAANPLERRADFSVQFGKMFVAYVVEQWRWWRGIGVTGALPVVAAAFGGWWHWRRHRPTAWMVAVHLVVMGPALVIYLNFTDNEVRARDYFFAGFFQVAAMWIGFGLAQGLGSLRRPLAVVLAVLALGAPVVANFAEANRRGDTIARDYAYNMLVPLPTDAILFTYGDNDTFPVWYLQHVEGLRTDVRVVNMSLLNTPWYLRQLRDGNPDHGVQPLPLKLSDAEIGALRPYRTDTGQVVLVRDIAIERILEDNAWRDPVYFAVTVPEKLGLEPRMTMECLAYRVEPEPTDERLNAEACRQCLFETFAPLRGILTDDGQPDLTFQRTPTEARLIQNYAAVHFYYAVERRQAGHADQALPAAERALAIAPTFEPARHLVGALYEDLGRLADAENHYKRLLAAVPGDVVVLAALGGLLARHERLAEAVPYLERAAALTGKNSPEPHAQLFEVYRLLGRRQEALAAIDRWLSFNPNDRQARAARDELVGSGDDAPP